MNPTSEVVIYHNPRCSKSRAALELLRGKGIEPRIVEYLENPPTPAEMERILAALDMEPRELMRRQEDEYAEAALDDPGLTRETLILAMLQRPRLIERPIVVCGERVALGRPPERILEILE